MRFLRVFTARSRGYTAIEMIVVISIMVAITSLVLVGFGTLNNTVALNRASRELAVGLRRAQNMSLAVSRNPSFAGEVPPAYGVHLVLDGTGYTLFADRGSPRNKKYDSSDPFEMISYTVFERNIRINRFLDVDGDQITPAGNTLHVIFSAPEADPVITDGDGNTDATGLYDKVDIILQSLSGEEKTITIRVSGQISIR